MEYRSLREVLGHLGAVAKAVMEHAEQMFLDEQPDDIRWEYKRMLYLPDGSVSFLDREESDEMMAEYDEMGIIPLPDEGLYIVFNEEHVVEHAGRRYVSGPILVRTSLDPDMETDMTRDEIRNAFDKLEANEDEIPFGGICIPVLALR